MSAAGSSPLEQPAAAQVSPSGARSSHRDEPLIPASDRTEAAVAYARRDWSVFLCVAGGKRPLAAAAPNGCKSATRDVPTIRALLAEHPAANIGIATGAPSGGLVVVDVDGAKGAESLRGIQAVHEQLPATLVARTGGGGWHVFFRASAAVGNSVGRLGPGLDVRGDGGYVVAPPSVTDGQYRWLTTFAPAPLPTWLEKLLEPQGFPPSLPPPPLPPERRNADGATRYGDAALRRKADAVRGARPGTRRDTLNGCAYALAQIAGAGLIDPDVVAAELERAALQQAEPQSLAEIRTTIARAIADGMSRPYHPAERSE